ncbi:MAG: zf-HC2 domain-containing protein [Treponema sp.]|nr:zf-HC2 domain-containing protein [Treponema sp.]
MCPDRQILSVSIDGELPSPWKEKLEAHLRSCAVCREHLEGYRRLSRVFGYDRAGIFDPVPGSTGEEAKERIWRKIAGPEGERRKTAVKFRYRTLSIPLPAAAAAAVVFVVLLMAVIFRQPSFTGDPGQEMASSGIGLDVQGIVPVSDMNGVLQYLGNQDTADVVTIQLPESKSFMSSGEPTIIKAADYSRRNGSR